jgi:hypothetical protein
MRTFDATTGDPTGSEYEALLERSTTVQRTPPWAYVIHYSRTAQSTQYPPQCQCSHGRMISLVSFPPLISPVYMYYSRT